MRRSQPITTLPLLLSIALVASQALAADFTGRVVGVSEGGVMTWWSRQFETGSRSTGRSGRNNARIMSLRREWIRIWRLGNKKIISSYKPAPLAIMNNVRQTIHASSRRIWEAEPLLRASQYLCSAIRPLSPI